MGHRKNLKKNSEKIAKKVKSTMLVKVQKVQKLLYDKYLECNHDVDDSQNGPHT